MGARVYRVRANTLNRPIIQNNIYDPVSNPTGRITVVLENGSDAYLWLDGLTDQEHEALAALPQAKAFVQGAYTPEEFQELISVFETRVSRQGAHAIVSAAFDPTNVGG